MSLGEEAASGDTAPVVSPSENISDSGPSEGINPSTEKAVEAAIKKYKIKIDDADVEFTDDDIKKHYNISRASGKKSRELAEVRKNTDLLIKKLQENPLEVLSKVLPSDRMQAMMEDHLYKHYQYEALDPKEKERVELTKKVKQYEESIQEQEEQRKNQRVQHLTKVEQEKYHTDIIGALSNSGLPKSPETIKRMAAYMSLGLQNNVHLKAEEVVQFVMSDYSNELKSVYSGMDEEKLMEVLGEDIANKIRKRDLAKAKANNFQTPKDQPKNNRSEEERPKMSKQDWRDKMSRIQRGLE